MQTEGPVPLSMKPEHLHRRGGVNVNVLCTGSSSLCGQRSMYVRSALRAPSGLSYCFSCQCQRPPRV